MSKKKTAPEPKGNPIVINWFTVLVAPMLFLLGTAIVFSYMLSDPTGARLMGIGDAWAHGGPMHFYMDYAIHQGELPLWNPLIYCGQPFAANPQSFLFHPPNLIRSLLTFDPTPWKTHVGIAILIWLQVSAGGYGTYLLARRHGLGYGPALAAGFAYAFSGGSITRAIGHWQFHNALMWVPFLLIAALAMVRADTARKRVAYGLCTGILYGLILLAGTPHFMVLSGFLLGLFVLFYRVAFIDLEAPKFVGTTIKRLFGDGLILAMIVIVAALMASPMLLPASEYAQFSPRASSEGGDGVQILERFGPEWNLWQLFSIYSGDETYEGIRGAGAVVFFLAICSIAFIRKREIIFYWLLFLAAVDCSLNEPYLIGKIFFAVSPYQMSGPPRGILLACLPLGLLAAHGLNAMVDAVNTHRERLLRAGAIVVAAFAVIGTLYYTAWEHPFIDPPRLVYLLPLAAAVILIIAQWWREPVIIGVVLAMIVFGETAVWSQTIMAWMAKDNMVYAGDMDALDAPQTMWADNRRGTDKEPNTRMITLDASINGYDPLYIDRVVELITPNNFEADFRRKVFHDEVTADQIRGHLFLKRSFWLARQYVQGPLPGYGALFPSATTVYTRDNIPPGMKRVLAEDLPYHAVSENALTIPIMREGQPPLVLDAQAAVPEQGQQAIRTTIEKMPPQHTVLRMTIKADCTGDLQPMLRDTVTGAEEFGYTIPIQPTGEKAMFVEIPMPDFLGLEFAMVPTFDSDEGRITITELYFQTDLNDEGDHIVIEERTPNTVSVRVNDLEGPRILSFIDSAYPGWSVTVDGETVPLLTVNEAFKGVYLTAGSHEVEFRFAPARVYIGIALGVITFVTTLLLARRLLRTG